MAQPLAAADCALRSLQRVPGAPGAAAHDRALRVAESVRARVAARAQAATAVGHRAAGGVLRRAAVAESLAMRKVRALVLVHSTLVPPDSLKGSTEKEIDEWRTEYDVISHLKKAGHEVMPLGLSDSLSELRRAITDWKPGIVFNLLEEFDGIVTYDQHVVAFLELMRQPY